MTWPIERAYIPDEDVFRASGLGMAGIVRRRPDGKIASSMFEINLMERGFGMMFGNERESLQHFARSLEAMRDHVPAFTEGTPEHAAAYIWGAWALAEAEGFSFPPSEAAFYFKLVPRLPGSSKDWLDGLIGPRGLVAGELMELIRATPPPEEIEEGREVSIVTLMTFRLTRAPSVVSRLRASSPEGKGFRFIPGQVPDDDSVIHFEWARPLPRGPLSIMPVRGGLQIQGWVDVEGDELRAVTMTLSMAARLVLDLKGLFGDAIKLERARWSFPDERMLVSPAAAVGKAALP